MKIEYIGKSGKARDYIVLNEKNEAVRILTVYSKNKT